MSGQAPDRGPGLGEGDQGGGVHVDGDLEGGGRQSGAAHAQGRFDRR